jgi:quercetin dioxygenase-like cupin family protein
MTVFHRAPVTKVLFAFEPGGGLADHAANGLVTIHAPGGHLTVQVATETYVLQAGMMVVLSPNVPHSVRAGETSAMLTVHLEGIRHERAGSTLFRVGGDGAGHFVSGDTGKVYRA